MKKSIILFLLIPFVLDAQNLDAKVEAESYSHQKRVQILQEADQCIHNAKNDEEYRACEVKENQARKDLQLEQKNKAKSQVLASLYAKRDSLDEVINCVENAQLNSDIKSCMKNYSYTK